MLPIMQREVDWIIDALARDPAKTRTGLAHALNIDKSGVSRLLKGDRRLKYEEAQLAAAYLGVTPGGGASATGLAEDPADYASSSNSGVDLATAPLFRAETSNDGFWRLEKSALIERRPRLPQFSGAQDVFGFYAPENSMAPRYHAG
ncbi:MAG: helix-turn-helix transcriptional regulator, partial [Pseudomonadota bacterium]